MSAYIVDRAQHKKPVEGRNGCACGCGQETAGGRYLRGHNRMVDARLSPDYAVRECGYETACWVWLKATNKGYGVKAVGRRMKAAHRLLYQALVGPVPAGMQLDHLCRNRACVNPAHLEVVTNAENSRRGARAKLTPERAREIRLSVEAPAALARRFGVSTDTIHNVRKGKTWRGA